MAQRVYLHCVPPDLIDLIIEAVDAASESAFDEVVLRLRSRASSQLRAASLSRDYGRRLDERAFERAGRIDDYYLAIGLRPYVITSPLGQGNPAVTAIRTAADEAELRAVFEAQLALIPDLTRSAPEAREQEGDPWRVAVEDLRRLRRMRDAAGSGSAFAIDVPRHVPFGDSGMMVQAGTEEVFITGKELAEAYGFLLGATLGRVSGLSEPSWWMGRNFWIGLMIAEEFGITERLTKRRLVTLRDQMIELASSPGRLFDPIAVAGYENGFPLMCEGYSSGLMFGADVIGAMPDLMIDRKSDWIALGVRASGHPEDAVSQLYEVTLEAFSWAATKGYSLMEGDELVGESGYR